MVPVRNEVLWRRLPNAHGSGGAIALHPTDAEFVLQRGWIKIDGRKAPVSFSEYEDLAGLVAVRVGALEDR